MPYYPGAAALLAPVGGVLGPPYPNPSFTKTANVFFMQSNCEGYSNRCCFRSLPIVVLNLLHIYFALRSQRAECWIFMF